MRFSFGAGVRYYPVGNLFARVGYSGLVRKGVKYSSYAAASVGYDWLLSDKVFFEPAVYYRKDLTYKKGHDYGLSLGAGVRF